MSADAIARGLATLTDWTAALERDAIPEPVRHRATLVLSYDLAAMVAARDEPELMAMQDGVAKSSGAAEATVFNTPSISIDRHVPAPAHGPATPPSGRARPRRPLLRSPDTAMTYTRSRSAPSASRQPLITWTRSGLAPPGSFCAATRKRGTCPSVAPARSPPIGTPPA